MMSPQFQIPTEVELLEFFGAEPVERTVDDGYWCYEVGDDHGTKLRLSFSLYERSVQTVLMIDSQEMAVGSHEAASRMTIRDRKLVCDFLSTDTKTTLTIQINGRVSVAWSTLRTL